VLKLAGGVEWVHVHRHHSGGQDAEKGYGVLEDVGHHEGHPVAGLELQFVLEVAPELFAHD